jgi:23S rRNA (cytidine1920-2'-O)/16S rRNA (cytidine1409-2'-O)-methyltransferase
MAIKPATGIDADTPVLVQGNDNEPNWVSRGAQKLLGALDGLMGGGPAVEGRRCLDAGASTGGFTDVLLHRGAREVTGSWPGRCVPISGFGCWIGRTCVPCNPRTSAVLLI